MSRVLSALVLLPLVVAVVWGLPPVATLGLAEGVLLLALREYGALARALGARPPGFLTAALAVATCAAAGGAARVVEVPLLAGLVALGVQGLAAPRSERLLHDIAASLFATVYLALPLGVVAALRGSHGAGAVLLLLATVMASDTAQYYAGRLLGHRPLAPALSPHKTVEGAAAGAVAGVATLLVFGPRVLPQLDPWTGGLLGLAIVALGVVGDLFESALKRGAGVKDASQLIPGHGGMLDRIDSLLFAAPVYYIFVQYAL